jgi:hypothetical protein
MLLSGGSDRKRRLFSCAAAAYVGTGSPDCERRRYGLESVQLCAELGEPLERCPELYANRSPLAGTVLRSPRQGAVPYALVGQLVNTSTTICLIEAMGVFNEVVAEHPGIVVEFAVEAGRWVEYDDLFTRTLWTEETESGRYRDGHVASLLRDIFGNPFHPTAFDPTWRTDTVRSLAQQMYESCDFSALPILADALQDAGCDSADILDHCRGAGPHVRGCWVVDLVLGKE